MEITIQELAAFVAQATTQPSTAGHNVSRTLGRYVVVRTYSAGVHVGVLEARNGREVALKDARRIWSWEGANTLHEIALHGVGEGSRVSETVDVIELTEAIEVIPCTDEAERNLRSAPWTKR